MFSIYTIELQYLHRVCSCIGEWRGDILNIGESEGEMCVFIEVGKKNRKRAQERKKGG